MYEDGEVERLFAEVDAAAAKFDPDSRGGIYALALPLWPRQLLAQNQEPRRASGEARSGRRLGHQAMGRGRRI
jgi:hypothetical protein